MRARRIVCTAGVAQTQC